MSGEVLTEVRAIVAADREEALVAGYRELLDGPLPDGLVGTELVRGPDGEWRILTRWRDHAALDAMRAGPKPPAAPALFREVGAEPVLTILMVLASHRPRD